MEADKVKWSLQTLKVVGTALCCTCVGNRGDVSRLMKQSLSSWLQFSVDPQGITQPRSPSFLPTNSGQTTLWGY